MTAPVVTRRTAMGLIAGAAGEFMVVTRPGSARAAGNDTLVITSGSDAVTMDPQASFDGQSPLIWRGVYEPLFAYEGGSLNIKPHLASYDVSSDGLTYTFKVKDGIKFTDGEVLDAAAVKFNIERQMAINLGIAYALKPVTKIDMPDSMTIVLHLSAPSDGLLSAFAGMYTVYMISPKAIRDHQKNGDWAQAWLRENMVGTGPYKLQRYVQSQQAVLKRNEHYWKGWDGAHLETIIVRYIKDASSARLLLERGETDIAVFLPDDVVESMDGESGLKVTDIPSITNYYVVLPSNVAPMNDVRVRKAIAYAFDYDGLVKNILGGRAKQARGPIPSNFPAFDPSVFQYKRDLAKSKQLLAEAGHPDGGFTLKFTYETGYWWKRPVGELLQSCLKELGIGLDIQELSPAAWAGMMSNPETAKLACYGLLWYPTLATPYDYIWSVFATSAQGTAGYNWGYYSNSTLDKLLDQASAETDAAKRAGLYGKAQQLIVDESPALFLYEKNYRLPMRSSVQGFVFNGVWFETFDFYALSKLQA